MVLLKAQWLLKRLGKVRALSSMLLMGWALLGVTGLALAAEKVEYKDIYLSENRVCKACRWEWVDKKKVRLVNRAGLASIVPARQVIAMDRYPLGRKIMQVSLHGIGLPGPVLVPAAFDDGNDYVCKYCDSFNH